MSYLETYKNRLSLAYGDACTSTKAEEQKQFLLFLKNYPNTFDIDYNTKVFRAGIISEKDSILQETYYLLLTELEYTINRGALITDGANTEWLVFNNAKNGISSYNRYKVLLCDKVIKWLDEYGNECMSSCYIQGTQKGNLSAQVSGSVVRVPEPNSTLLIIMPQENFKRGKRFIIEDKAWKVTGYDAVSFPGVCFLSLLEDVIDEQSDNLTTDIALNKIDDYTIEMVADTYDAIVGEVFDIHYQVFKNGVPMNEPCMITLDNTNAISNGKTVICGSAGTVTATVQLSSNTAITGTCVITIAETRLADNENAIITGANSIKWGRTQSYIPTLYTNGVPESMPFTANVVDTNNLVTWSKIGTVVNITAKVTNVTGSITLEIEFANHETISKTIDIISL